MNECIEKEIVRLIKEIAKDEKSIKTAESWDLPEKVEQYRLAIDRKLAVLKVLKED